MNTTYHLQQIINKSKICHANIKIYNKNPLFGSYLAGLWEGDGHINRKSRLTYKPTLGFTFGSNQRPLVLHLKAFFDSACDSKLNTRSNNKTGSICSIHEYSRRNALCLTLLDISALRLFLKLALSYVRTPKAYDLNLLINYFKHVHMEHLPGVMLNSQALNQDAWLTGFSEADGSFGLRQSIPDGRRPAKHKITECTFVLTQSQKHIKCGLSIAPLFDKIAYFIKGNVIALHRPKLKGKPQYRIKVSSAKSKLILRHYFDAYALLSSKYLDYCDWCKADDIMLAKNHYTPDGVKTISSIKARMNNSRKEFNWCHLENVTFKY